MKIEGTKQQWIAVLGAVVGTTVGMIWGAPFGATLSPPIVLGLAAIIIVLALAYIWRERRRKSK